MSLYLSFFVGLIVGASLGIFFISLFRGGRERKFWRERIGMSREEFKEMGERGLKG